MFRRFTFVAGVLALAAFACVGAGQEKKADVNGDPLPAGALARMGTLRMRHGETVSFVAFTQDGKAVLTAANDNTIRLWDRETGKELRRFDQPAPAGAVQPGGRIVFNPYQRLSARIALSKDGKMLATIVQNNIIQLWNVETGKELRQIKGAAPLFSSVLFAPDGKSIAARSNDRTIYLLDTATGNEIRQIKVKPANNAGGARVVIAGGIYGADNLAFSHDGKTIATAEAQFDMQKVTAYIRVVETETGKDVRSIDTPQNTVTSVAFSPDGKVLAYALFNAIYLREAATGKEIRTINTASVTGIVFSPDSKTLAVKGRDQVVRLFETDSGKATFTLGDAPAPGVNVGFVFAYGDTRDFAFSPDGKLIGIGNGQTLRFFNVATGKDQSAAGGGHRGAVLAVLLTPDGKTMISRGADNHIRRWDAITGKELSSFVEPKGTTAAALSPDGKLAALANTDGNIRLVSTADGNEVHKVKGHANGQTASLAFSPDSKVLASRGSFDGVIRLYDAVKGGELKQIMLPGANPNMAGGGFVRPGYGVTGQAVVFSPDGQTIAANVNAGANTMVRPVNPPAAPGVASALHMWDVATGKEIRKITLPANRNVANLAFSPDGRLLASENSDQTLSLWEIASGRERALLGMPIAIAGQPNQPFVAVGGFGGMVAGGSNTTATLAFSPDGTLLAARAVDKSVRVWQISHGKEIGTLKGHEGAVNAVAFAADGKSLASASADTTLLVWDVAALKREPAPAAANLTAKDVEALWADLIADDAGKAGRSIQTLVAAAKLATPLLSEKLKPATPPDVKKINQWISELDSTDFKKRTLASVELEKLGELALPALRKVLETRPSPEVRRRVEPLLEKLTTGVLSAEQVRMIRAVEVLEKAGGSDARAVLETLVKGAPGALTTRQAQAALDRMVK